MTKNYTPPFGTRAALTYDMQFLSLSTAAWSAVQNKVSGVVGVPSSASQLLTSSIYRDLAQPDTISLPDGSPRIDYLGEISTGYGNRPYQGGTAFVRLLYLF